MKGDWRFEASVETPSAQDSLPVDYQRSGTSMQPLISGKDSKPQFLTPIKSSLMTMPSLAGLTSQNSVHRNLTIPDKEILNNNFNDKQNISQYQKKSYYSKFHRRKPSYESYLFYFHINEPDGSTVVSSSINLANTILGAGLLSIPYAIAHCGWLLGIILFVLFGLVSYLGLYLIMISSKKFIPNASFSELSVATIPKLQILVDISIITKCFGVCLSYLIVIGDVFPDAIDHICRKSNCNDISTWKSRRLWISIFLLPILYLVKFNKFEKLKYTSGLALICFIYVVIVVLLYNLLPNSVLNGCDSYSSNSECKGNFNAWPTNPIKFIKVIPIFIFAFTAHQNAAQITNELKNPNKLRINLVSIICVILCLFVYLLTGLNSYNIYGNKIKSNLLLSYPQSWLVTILRILLSFAIVFSYPLVFHPLRESLSYIIFKKSSLMLGKLWFNIITYVVVFLSYGLSLYFKHLGSVLSIVGGTGSTVTSFILPGLYYYYLHIDSNTIELDILDNRNIILLHISKILVIIGCLIMPITIIVQFL